MKVGIKDFIYWLLIIGVLFLLLKQCRSSRIDQGIIEVNEALRDTMVQYKNKYNQEVTERRSIEFENIKQHRQYIAKLDSKDSLIIRLQKKLKDMKGSGVAIDMTTSVAGQVKTEVTHDTVAGDSSLAPVYNFIYQDDWVNLKVKSEKDSSSFSLQVKNKLDIVTIEKRDKFLGPKYTAVQITQLSPYSHTDNVQSFTIKPKRFPLGLTIGLSALGGAAAMWYLTK